MKEGRMAQISIADVVFPCWTIWGSPGTCNYTLINTSHRMRWLCVFNYPTTWEALHCLQRLNKRINQWMSEWLNKMRRNPPFTSVHHHQESNGHNHTHTDYSATSRGLASKRQTDRHTDRELSAPKTTTLKSHWCRDKSSTTFRLTTKEQEQYNF